MATTEQPTVTSVVNSKFKEVVSQFRNNTATKESVKQLLNEASETINTRLIGTKHHRIFNDKYKFFTTMVYYPSVWLKIMLTLVFWVTLDEVVISSTIKQLFETVDMSQNATLQTKHFVYNSMGTDKAAKANAAIWYDSLIRELAEDATITSSQKIEAAKDILKQMVKSCNEILAYPDGRNNDIGTKALAACEASARGTTLFHYLKLMGCLSGLVAEGSPECTQIRQALKNLIEGAENLDL